MALSNVGILAQPSTVAALAPACDRLHELRWAPVPTTDKEALHQFDALLCEPPIGPECPTCIPLLGLVHAPAIAAWRERVTAQPGDHLSLDLVVPPQARVDQFMSEIVGLALVVLDTATPTLGPDLTRLDWNGRSVAINQH